MKWSDVQITDLNDKVHTGMKALNFVEANCKPFANSIKGNDLIEVNTYSPSASTEDKDVRLVLFSKLKGKAKSLRFLTGDTTPREILPLARATKNVFNVIPTKLKVEFIYKQDPLKNDPPKPFKELPIKVTSSLGISMDATDGVADFNIVAPGKYKLTIAFHDLDQNKFDFSEATEKNPGIIEREVELDPGDDHTVIVEVVPLYTKVVFVGHCLLTIAKQTYNVNTKEWGQEYNGLMPETMDIEKRVKLLDDVIKKASGLVGDNEDELKVFLAPECFFLGPNGAYSITNLSDELIPKLQEKVKDAKWKHWVFAFGTVNAAFEVAGKFLELLNNAPVIRGGFESMDKAPDYTKLIQKTYYSAEMPKQAELDNPTAEQFYGEMFRLGFSTSENEYIFGRQVRELLAITWDNKEEEWVPAPGGEPLIDGKTIDAFCVQKTEKTDKKWKTGDWTDLRNKAINQLETRGMTCVARDVREAYEMKDVKMTTVKVADWGAKLFKNVFDWYVNSKTDKVPTAVINDYYLDDFTFRCARKPGPWLKDNSLRQNRRINFGLEICADHSYSRLRKSASEAEREITKASAPANEKLKFLNAEKTKMDKDSRDFPSQKEGLEKGIKLLEENNLAEAELTVKNAFGDVFDKNKWEELLKERTERLDEIKERKPKLEEELKQVKEEIAGFRLQMDAAKKQQMIDIHLLPSAGMAFTPEFLAARPEGYAFNCDGWNAVSVNLKNLEKRVSTENIILINKPNLPQDGGHNPLRPHTEVMKIPMKQVVASSYVDLTEDASGIFAEGAGQLHIYPPQDLPN